MDEACRIVYSSRYEDTWGVCEHTSQQRAMTAVKALIVDDNASFRQRIKELLVLDPDIVVVGEVAGGREAVCKARQLDVGLVLMDVWTSI